MDILQELPLDQWPILQEQLKQLWPINLPGYYALKINLKYPKLREEFQFKVYCHRDDVQNGFVGISKVKGTQDCVIFSPTGDTSKLEEAITKTKLIDWKKRVCFNLVTSRMINTMKIMKDLIGFRIYHVGMVKIYVLDRITKPFTDLRLPDNTYAAPVKREHISRVDDTWPYKHADSHYYFTTLASNRLSYGLYSCNHDLLAWVFVNEYNSLCHLFCEERFRKKGCAEYVMKWAVNEQLRDGNDVYGCVVEGNKKPVALLSKLGFRAFHDSALFFVKKNAIAKHKI